jgi:hypothetical protein
MKIYKPKKVLTYFRVLLLVGIILFLNNNTLTYVTVNKVRNNNLDKMVEREIIDGTQALIVTNKSYNIVSTFTGELSGYAGDCPKCSGVVACAPYPNVLETGVFFNDEEYGNVRIVASSSKYPCGTVLKFNVDKLSTTPLIAVVLDRGVGGDKIDLLTESENFARIFVGRVKNQTFEVLRLGW